MSTPLDPSLRTLTDCGCCEGQSSTAPGAISGAQGEVFNRPGLSAIAYRSGTWHEMKAAMLTALASQPALAGLATRADDDFTIALLDSVATVGDVLTFYQERIANESYLRTATERLSIGELAALIGYRLKPGVAAGTWLSFTVDETPGAPRVASIAVGLKVQSVPGQDEKPQTFETVEAIEARAEWNAMRPRLTAPQSLGMMETKVWLAGTETDLRRGDFILLVGSERANKSGDERWDVRRVLDVTAHFADKRTEVTVGPGLGSFSPFSMPSASPSVYALRTRAAIYGHNAADWRAMSKEFKANYLDKAEGDLTATDKAEWPAFSIVTPGTTPTATVATIDLDGAHPSIAAGSWLVLASPEYVELYKVTKAVAASRSGFGLAAKTTRVTLDGENYDRFTGLVRATAVYAGSEKLERADAPITPPVTGTTNVLTLDRHVGLLPEGRTLLLAGKNATTGEDVTETVVLDHAEIGNGVTRLILTTALTRSYRLDSLVIHGNVAAATQGESVTEVLGGGNAGRAYQRFTLRQPPLTCVRSREAASGVSSTLAVRVNDLLWQEAPSFYGHGPAERIYVTRRDDEGKTEVLFGDGVHGARLPTGQENVRATYRKGVGAGGNVRAGQLTNLLTKPLGLKDAANPVPATGGDDPETRDAARQNAPLTVLTLDRVVSLLDHESFARAYAGIAKALATWSWNGERRGIFITVAGPDGAPVTDEVVGLLTGAIRQAGDPYVPLRVRSFRAARFTVSFKLKVDAAYEKAKVHTAVVAALRRDFGFDARRFGQPVALSDVIASIHSVAGVVAADVDTLRRKDGLGGSGLLNPLPAALPQATSLESSLAAELLTLADDPIVPGDMS